MIIVPEHYSRICRVWWRTLSENSNSSQKAAFVNTLILKKDHHIGNNFESNQWKNISRDFHTKHGVQFKSWVVTPLISVSEDFTVWDVEFKYDLLFGHFTSEEQAMRERLVKYPTDDAEIPIVPIVRYAKEELDLLLKHPMSLQVIDGSSIVPIVKYAKDELDLALKHPLGSQVIEGSSAYDSATDASTKYTPSVSTAVPEQELKQLALTQPCCCQQEHATTPRSVPQVPERSELQQALEIIQDDYGDYSNGHDWFILDHRLGKAAEVMSKETDLKMFLALKAGSARNEWLMFKVRELKK